MLTFKDHEFIIDEDHHLVGIWDDEKLAYQYNTYEFIEDLYELVLEAKQRGKPIDCRKPWPNINPPSSKI